MKKLSLIVILFLVANFSSFAQQNINDARIEYTANTRGFYQKIYIADKKIAVSKDRNDTIMPAGIAISAKDYKFLTAEFKKIKLAGLSKLKPPTQKRQYDGAAIADLKIVVNKKTYQTQSFDNGYPNLKIKKFVDKIISLAKE